MQANNSYVLSKNNFFLDGEFEFINHCDNSGSYNMDFDIKRSEEFANGDALQMLRLYSWTPWCVSLGYNQKIDRIDEELCKKSNFDIIRRPTGGRAVLHANELTYCVVTRISNERNQHDLYREIHTFLVDSFKSLGVNLDFERSNPNFRDLYAKDPSSVSCFASSAKYEIMHENKKIVGSAQRLFGNILLQHGSILLSSGHERLADIIKVNSDEERNRIKQSMLHHSSTLSEVAQREISYHECADAIANQLQVD